MKFACDNCATKYTIADERVRGRILRIRCKKCDHVVSVREPSGGGGRRPEPEEGTQLSEPPGAFQDDGEHTKISMMLPEAAPAAEEWFVSFDGVQEGPMRLAAALDRVRSERGRGKEAHAWRAGFFAWLPVEDIAEFEPAVRGGKSESRRPPASSRPPGIAARAATQNRPSPARMSAPVVSSSRSSMPSPASAAVARASAEPLRSEPARETEPQAVEPLSDSAPQPAADPRAVDRSAPGRLRKDAINRPSVSKDPTGPRAALGVSVDARPVALPPPPSVDSFKQSPLSKSGGRAALRDDGKPRTGSQPVMTRTGPQPAMTRTGPQPAMSKTGSQPALRPQPPVDAFKPSPLGKSGSTPKLPDADLAASPAPSPADELKFDEPSVAALRPTAANSALPTPVFGMDQLGDLGPAALTNGTGPAPVLVVAGPVPRGHHVFKWVAVLGVLGVLLLGGVVVFLVTRPPRVQKVRVEVPTAPVAKAPGTDDRPVAIPEVGRPQQPVAEHRTASPPVRRPSRSQPKSGTLTSSPGNGARSPFDEDTHDAVLDKPTRAATAVSDSSLRAVVTQNQRSLSACYERVLRHDPTLKRARILVQVKIGISGMATGVSVPPEYAQTEIGTCLVQTVKHWHFPASDSDYQTEFPLLLQAQQ